MRLTSIKLAGFKSFADATTIPIRSKMSAIVGPNGCGKSNVVDAIRWVIGETSAKQLRGQSMSDVIFNGTSSRKPVGKAAVELVFDNSNARIGGEFAKYNEISIRREVERDGQSNYFINGTACRRRDIVDIFLGTGLGPRSYAIIEQGMVARLIEAKPEETRVYLEEAAGISKYKERRRETENRMRRTQENLERLNDLRDELAKQLRHLKRQASAAERYKEYKQTERLLHAQSKALQWRLLQTELQTSNEQINQKQLLHEEKLTEQRHLETEIEKVRLEQTELNEKQNQIQKTYYQQGAEIARLEQRIQSGREQSQQWQSELTNADSLWQEITENNIQQDEQIKALDEDIAKLRPQTSLLQSAAAESQQQLTLAETNMNAWQQHWDDFQSELAQTERQVEVATTKIEHYQQQLTSLKKRVANLTTRPDQQSIQQLTAEISPLAQQIEEIKTNLSRIKEEIQQLTLASNQQRQINTENNKKLHKLRNTLQAYQQRYASLKALQQAALDGKDNHTKAWLAKSKLQDNARLGSVLQVVPGWELAVETVLSQYIDAVCVDQIEDHLAALSDMTAGYLTLLGKVNQSVGMHAATRTKAMTLANLVECDWTIAFWLMKVYAVESLQQALSMQSNLSFDESVITKDGIWLGRNWVRIAKHTENETGVLVREQDMQALEQQIHAQQHEIHKQEQQIQHGETHLLTLEEQREALHKQYQEAMSQQSHQQAQLSSKQARISELAQQQKRINQEMHECQHQISRHVELLRETEQVLQQATTNQTILHQNKKQLLENRAQLRDCLAAARKKAQNDKQAIDEFQIRLSSNESQLDILKQSVARGERQLQQLFSRRATLSSQLSEINNPIAEWTEELQSRLSQRHDVEQQLHAAENDLLAKNQQLKELEASRNQLNGIVTVASNELQEFRLQQQSIQVRQSSLQEQIQESSFQLNTLLQDLPNDANEADWQEQLESIARRISRLGPINLAAIDEHKHINERKDYLDKQQADLTEALTLLQAAIRKIDKETREKFRATFDQVNKGFQTIFPKIFAGGHASLELLADDLLTTGVIVRAQPPGKRNVNIHMLSGGEKALTAISLVFALFALNPAPFCILDEVDAPLDDVNVGRFCHLVKEMSAETQFILISHNKLTIETADHLMGVTMQEAGVSRIVSVDIAEAIEMATEAA